MGTSAEGHLKIPPMKDLQLVTELKIHHQCRITTKLTDDTFTPEQVQLCHALMFAVANTTIFASDNMDGVCQKCGGSCNLCSIQQGDTIMWYGRAFKIINRDTIHFGEASTWDVAASCWVRQPIIYHVSRDDMTGTIILTSDNDHDNMVKITLVDGMLKSIGDDPAIIIAPKDKYSNPTIGTTKYWFHYNTCYRASNPNLPAKITEIYQLYYNSKGDLGRERPGPNGEDCPVERLICHYVNDNPDSNEVVITTEPNWRLYHMIR